MASDQQEHVLVDDIDETMAEEPNVKSKEEIM